MIDPYCVFAVARIELNLIIVKLRVAHIAACSSLCIRIAATGSVYLITVVLIYNRRVNNLPTDSGGEIHLA
jgi:hypothetical protein